jgi:hypothetical protein
MIKKKEQFDDNLIKIKAVVDYCYNHLDKMWAARVVAILMGCDFRDSKNHADVFFEKMEELGL